MNISSVYQSTQVVKNSLPYMCNTIVDVVYLTNVSFHRNILTATRYKYDWKRSSSEVVHSCKVKYWFTVNKLFNIMLANLIRTRFTLFVCIDNIAYAQNTVSYVYLHTITFQIKVIWRQWSLHIKSDQRLQHRQHSHIYQIWFI